MNDPLANPHRDDFGLMIARLIVLVGLLQAGSACWYAYSRIDLQTNGLHAEGEVTSISSAHAVVHFKDADGKDVEFTDGAHATPPLYDVGEKVSVSYWQRDPAGTAILNHGWMDWLFAGALGGVGVIVLLAGLFFYTVERGHADAPTL